MKGPRLVETARAHKAGELMQVKGEKEAGHPNCQEEPPHLECSPVYQCVLQGFVLVRNHLRQCSELEPPTQPLAGKLSELSAPQSSSHKAERAV